MMQLRMQKKIWGGNLPESRREKQNLCWIDAQRSSFDYFLFFEKILLDINSLFLREAEAKEYEDEDDSFEYEYSDEGEDEEEYDEEGEEEEFEDDEEYDSEEFEDDAEGLSFRGKLERMVLIKLNPILPCKWWTIQYCKEFPRRTDLILEHLV